MMMRNVLRDQKRGTRATDVVLYKAADPKNAECADQVSVCVCTRVFALVCARAYRRIKERE